MLVALGESYEKLERMQQAKNVSSAQRVYDFENQVEIFILTVSQLWAISFKCSFISVEFLDLH